MANKEIKSNFDNFLKDTQETLDYCMKLLSSKNHDYSTVADPFLNFKESARFASITPAQVALVQIGNKMSRLTQLVGAGKDPMNEKVEDTIVDIVNYLLLLKGILKENN